MVVSEIGELWSPHTEPARTAPKLAIKKASPPGTAFIMSPANGINIPNAPHDVPVANAIRPATTNNAGTSQIAPIARAATKEARYSPVPNVLIRSPRTQANSRISTAGTIDFAPWAVPRRRVPGWTFSLFLVYLRQ